MHNNSVALVLASMVLRGIHTTYGTIRRRFDVSADLETCSISAAFLPYGNVRCCRFVANGGVQYDHVLIFIRSSSRPTASA